MMEFGLREWLFILGPLFIVGILAHGYWRMRSNRHNLKMALDRTYVSKQGEEESGEDDLAHFRAELPNGGARVRIIPEQTSLDLKSDVPMLMDSIGESDIDEPTIDEPMVALRDEVVELESTEPLNASNSVDTMARDQNLEAQPEKTSLKASLKERPEKYVVIYVISLNEPFPGQNLLENFVEQNLTFGEMDIFHRLDSSSFSTFSVVNAVEPGTFDIASMAEMSTPGISLFMRVHELSDPVSVFINMVDVAQELALELGGEVRDESRSAMTHQTIEHCKLEISEYQFKNRN
jgi:cell division protein ZipA